MPDEAPARKLTIRVGDQVHTNVKDFLLVVRYDNDVIASQRSSDSWALGAMERETLEIRMDRWRDRGGDA